MEWLQVSPFLSEVPWSRTAFQFLAILGHENFCHSPEDLEPSLAERPCSHWGGLATFPGHISSSSQNPHHCSHFRSGGNQFLIFCHLPWPFLSFPLEDIIRNLIKEFRFLQKSGKAFGFRPSALKKIPKARNCKELGYEPETGRRGNSDRMTQTNVFFFFFNFILFLNFT